MWALFSRSFRFVGTKPDSKGVGLVLGERNEGLKNIPNLQKRRDLLNKSETKKGCSTRMENYSKDKVTDEFLEISLKRRFVMQKGYKTPPARPRAVLPIINALERTK